MDTVSENQPHRPNARRAVVAALISAPALLCPVRAQSVSRIVTPSQTEGPFYPEADGDDVDFDLLTNGTLRYGRGQPTWVEGTVTDVGGRPVAGASVEIWQCDEAGHYRHPRGGPVDAAFQGFGRVRVGLDGRYRFRTLKPVAYPGRTPHIHVKVVVARRAVLTTQLYVAGDPRNARDGVWRSLDDAGRAAVTVPFRPGDDGLVATFPIVLPLSA